MAQTTMATRFSRAFATPVALSLAAHALVIGVFLMLPEREAPPPSRVSISNVTLEVRAAAKVEAPPLPPPAALPHRDLPPPAPTPPKKRVERLLPPRNEKAPPREVKKLAEVSKAPAAAPKLGVAPMPSPTPALPGDTMIIAAGDPHGDVHGHPHATSPAIEPVLTPPEPIAAPPPPPPAPPPPAPVQVEPSAPRGPVPLRLLSRRPQEVEIVKATYPDDARLAGIEGVVVLSLLLDEAGRVREARVKRKLGYGLDDAARKALLGSRFTPALDQRGAPCSTRITYRYQFTLD